MNLETMYHELTEIVRSKYPEGSVTIEANITDYGDGFRKQLKVFIRHYNSMKPDMFTTTSYNALKANVEDYVAGEQEEIKV